MWRMPEKSIYVRQREGDCPSLWWGWGALRRGRRHAGVGLAVILFVVVKKLY